MLLTRSPLIHTNQKGKRFTVRLACVKHAASVRPEPGSNSPHKNAESPKRLPKNNNQPHRTSHNQPTQAHNPHEPATTNPTRASHKHINQHTIKHPTTTPTPHNNHTQQSSQKRGNFYSLVQDSDLSNADSAIHITSFEAHAHWSHRTFGFMLPLIAITSGDGYIDYPHASTPSNPDYVNQVTLPNSSEASSVGRLRGRRSRPRLRISPVWRDGRSLPSGHRRGLPPSRRTGEDLGEIGEIGHRERAPIAAFMRANSRSTSGSSS